MVSLDGSILAALAVFLTVAATLNVLLLRPLLEVQAERRRRTTGLVAEAGKSLDLQREQFQRYEATIRQARLDAYRRQEQVRSEAAGRRAAMLDEARRKSEGLLQEARTTVQAQVAAVQREIGRESGEIARAIAASVLQRPA